MGSSERGNCSHHHEVCILLFFQTMILMGDKSQAPNHCGFTNSLEVILASPFPSSLLSLAIYTRFFCLSYFVLSPEPCSPSLISLTQDELGVQGI